MSRHCARPGCGEAAAATLAYDYGGQTVWLDDLAAEPVPQTYDLCRRHAKAMSVPLGWLLRDQRNLIAELAPARAG